MSDVGAINNPGGASGTATPATGGTGIDTSASTGVAQVAAGTWSVNTALANATTATTQAANSKDTKVATDAYVDRVIAAPLFTGNSATNTVRIAGADFTSAAAGQTAITGLAWTLPANTAANYVFEIHLTASQATAGTALTFSVNSVTVAPTAGTIHSIGLMTGGSATPGTGVTYTTTGSKTFLTFTPVSTVAFLVDSYILIEYPSNASTSVFQVELGVSGGANTVTVRRGSWARVSTAV